MYLGRIFRPQRRAFEERKELGKEKAIAERNTLALRSNEIFK